MWRRTGSRRCRRVRSLRKQLRRPRKRRRCPPLSRRRRQSPQSPRSPRRRLRMLTRQERTVACTCTFATAVYTAHVARCAARVAVVVQEDAFVCSPIIAPHNAQPSTSVPRPPRAARALAECALFACRAACRIDGVVAPRTQLRSTPRRRSRRDPRCPRSWGSRACAHESVRGANVAVRRGGAAHPRRRGAASHMRRTPPSLLQLEPPLPPSSSSSG